MIARARKQKLTVLSFGGGQDSTAILYRLIYDQDFRQQYAPERLLVQMADTGNEHPKTYLHVNYCEKLCAKHNIPFIFITSDLGFHTEAWLSLTHQYDRSRTCGMKTGKKSCTSALKIAPFYKCLSHWVGKQFGYDLNRPSHNYRNLEEFFEDYGQIRVLLGIASGEEKRVDKSSPTKYGLWMRSIQKSYPLIEHGMDRAACQNYIRSTGHNVPMPSNCMLCPFLSLIELLWLYRTYPDHYHRWVEMERRKIKKFAAKGDKNHGVFGKLLLPQALLQAVNKHGHMTDDELWEYKMSHGHCVSSAY